MASIEGDYSNAADEVFLSGGDGVAMLDEDQQDFERENICNQYDSTSGLESSCLSLPDSWSLRSHLTLSPPSFMGSVDESVRDCLRVSIGSFIGSKTEALGSLGKEGTSERPTFGTEFSTPPRNRMPVPLMDLVDESDGSVDDDPDFGSSSMDETLTSCNRIILSEETDFNSNEGSCGELPVSGKLQDSTSVKDVETGNDALVPSTGGTATVIRTAGRNRIRPAFVQPLDVIVEVPSERNSSTSSSRVTDEMEKPRESDSVEPSQNTNETRDYRSLEKTGEGNGPFSNYGGVQPAVNLLRPVLDDTVPKSVVHEFVQEKDYPQSVTSLSSSSACLNLQTPLNEHLYGSDGLHSKQHPGFYSLNIDSSQTFMNRTAEYTQVLAVAGESSSSLSRTNYERSDPTAEKTSDFRSLMLSSSSYIMPGAQPSKQRERMVEQLRPEESQRSSRAAVEQALILNRIKVMAANGELGTKFRNASSQINCKDAILQRSSEMPPRDRRKRNKENVDPERVRDRPATVRDRPATVRDRPATVRDLPATVSAATTNSNRNDRSGGNSESDISWKSPKKTPKRGGTSSRLDSEMHRTSTASVILSPETTLNTDVAVSLGQTEPLTGDRIASHPRPVNGDDDTMSFSSVQTNFSEMFIGLPPKLLVDSHPGAFRALTSGVGHAREGVRCDRGISPNDFDEPVVCPTDTVATLSELNRASVFSSSSAAQDRQKMPALRTSATPCAMSSECDRAIQPPVPVTDTSLESYSFERIDTHSAVQESVLTTNAKFPAAGTTTGAAAGTTAAGYVTDKESSTSHRAGKVRCRASNADGTKSTPVRNLTKSAVLAGDAVPAQSTVPALSADSMTTPTVQPDATSAPSATSIQAEASLQRGTALPSAIVESSGIEQNMTSLVLPHPSKALSKSRSCQNFAINRFLSGENHSSHDSSKRLPQNTQTLPRSSNDQTTIDLSSLSCESSSKTQFTSCISSSTLPSKRATGPQLDTARTSGRKSLIVPLEVRVRDVCCVGLSTQDTLQVQNPSENWVKVTFEVTKVTVDGKPMNDCFTCPFSLKNKTLIEPKSSEEIKIIFVPRVSGVFVAQLHLHSSPVAADELAAKSSKLPIMVTLQAIAEKPSIQVTVAGGGSNLHLGPIPWGNHSSGTICLINRGRAHIPVRLAISSISSNCCFSFEKQSESHTSKIPNKRHPLTSLIYSCTLPSMDITGCLKPVAVPIHFVSPDRQYGAVEEFRGRVVAEVDAISTPFHLGIVELIGKAGTAKIHVPCDMNGQQDAFSVPMLNAGNIHIVVSLQVSMSCDMFEVSPKEFILEPAQEKHISIKFKPTLGSAAVNKVSSILLIMVRPDGPFYKIRLFGLTGKSVDDTPGKSLGHHMMGFSQDKGIKNDQITCQALQEGFSSHLKDQSNCMRLDKPLSGQSKWADVLNGQSKYADAASREKQKSRSVEVSNRPGTSVQQNASSLKEVVSEPTGDDAMSNRQRTSVKLLHSKDSDVHIHAIPERDVPTAFLTSTSSTSDAASNPSAVVTTDNEAAVWTVKPDKITLPSSCAAVNCEPVIKRIQIINYTKNSMPFKLAWPEKFITVTPEVGNVLPRSSTVVCLSANIGLQQKGLPLPWTGAIRILSETEAKHVSVKIVAEGECSGRLRQECEVEGVISEFGQQCEDGVIGSVRIPDAELGDEANTTSRHQRLNFQPTIIKSTVDRVLEISNLSRYHLKWTMTAFAPVYIKKPGQSGCRRLHYSVFWLPLQGGILHPGGQVKVVVCFCPREVGFYSQFWEVVFESSDVKRNISQISRIELFASSVTETRDCSSVSSSNCSYCERPKLSTNSAESDESTGSPSSLEVPSRDNLISVMPLEVTFPVSVVNKKSTAKVVMKNRDSKPYRMEITVPDKPFYTRYKILKLESRHYLSVPFDFLPKAKGYYESTLLLKSDKGDTFTVTLNGTCE